MSENLPCGAEPLGVSPHNYSITYCHYPISAAELVVHIALWTVSPVPERPWIDCVSRRPRECGVCVCMCSHGACLLHFVTCSVCLCVYLDVCLCVRLHVCG